jgi:hypothetical protein
MGLLDSLKTAYQNNSPSVDRDQLAEDVDYLKNAVDILAGAVSEVDVDGGDTVTVPAYSNGCMFYVDGDPVVVLEAGVDTVVPVVASSDLTNGLGTDAIVNDDDAIEIVTPGVYAVSWHFEADADAADHTAERLIAFSAYLVYNDEAVGPFYNFLSTAKYKGDTFVNPLVVEGSVTSYLAAGDVLAPNLNLSGASLSDDGVMASINDLEMEYLEGALVGEDIETGSINTLRAVFFEGLSDPEILDTYVAESTLTPVARYSKNDHIISGLEALIAAL